MTVELRSRTGLAVTYRGVQPADLPAVVGLHRASFPEDQVARSIYGGHGIATYLAERLAGSTREDDHVLTGAWVGAALAGYAHQRAVVGSWHLNQIAVSPAYQTMGIGRGLWKAFVRTARRRGYRCVSLHVDRDSPRVVSWYARRGLRATHTVWSYETTPRGLVRNSGLEVRLADWEEAERRQRAYGFSRFRLVSDDGRVWSIGRLGSRYFRTAEPLPQIVEARLASLDPRRRLLLQTSTPVSAPEWTLAGAALHMEGPAAVSDDAR